MAIDDTCAECRILHVELDGVASNSTAVMHCARLAWQQADLGRSFVVNVSQVRTNFGAAREPASAHVAHWLLDTGHVWTRRCFPFMVIGATAASVLDAEADTPIVDRSSAQTEARDPAALRTAAGEALARGDFAAALALYEQLSALDRSDAHAVREAGRAAHALGEFARAAALLRRAAARANQDPDPELHYLLGEALFALGQLHDARREHDLVEQQLAGLAPSRQSQLWLARVYTRRGELARADALYQALAPPADQPVDLEVALARAEAHTLNKDWDGARRILEDLLARAPRHARAQDMLAWTLEASGREADELALRAVIARQPTSRQMFDYARALERSGDFAAALRAYRSARQLALDGEDPELTASLQRMQQLTSIEVAATVLGRSDANASSLGEQVGLAVPFAGGHHYAFGAWHERLSSDSPTGSRSCSAAELWAALALHHRRLDAVAGADLGLYLPGGGHAPGNQVSWGGFASLRARPIRHLKLALDAELEAPWRDTPLALLEAGHVTGVTANLYGLALGDRVIGNAGVQPRRLTLEAGAGEPGSSQLLGWAGLDVVAWANFASSLTGWTRDDNLRWPTQLADSVVASYRHYELRSSSDPEFMARISMLPRATIDEGSLVARKVLARGRIGVELRGSFGWDHARDLAISRAGASFLAVPTLSSRIALTFDIGAESTSGFGDQVRAGWVSYHADL